MILPFFFPLWLICGTAGLEKPKNLAREVLRLIQDRLSDAEFGKNLANLSNQFASSANHRFEFQKRTQLFVRTHNETAFRRRDARQQSRSFVLGNQRLRRNPSSNRVFRDC
jgi:hypothetical protein